MAREVGTQPTSVVITVPRHASAAASEELINEVKKLAESEGKHFVNDFTGTPQMAKSRAMYQASEWNSLLLSARASRGPQWDVGIQQYLVDKESDLYYDPTPLSQTDASNDNEGPEGSESAPGMGNMQSNSEGGTPLTPRFGDDGPVMERRQTRARGGL
ncbi:hypothetical protein RhiJN_03637 [Ceratobasidium sp. AG-Ba]|nr:hypothetical protein RhiJN_03637 [Ceratobasidium sp. AG-Ba]QRW04527.1 hypothetical protein RhiLY_03526 [Ceratobasidium sp. AG-Ba]